MTAFLESPWLAFVGPLTVLASVLASAHVVLNKRDVSSAIGWVGIMWLVPVLGPALYVVFGINRIRRRASRLRPERLHRRPSAEPNHATQGQLSTALSSRAQHLRALRDTMATVTSAPLTAGNELTPLIDGDEAFPAMIEAIDRAAVSIALSTYIFDNDNAGLMFADALQRAIERGVEVRVLIDAVGARYSTTSIVSTLRDRDIPVALFLPPVFSWRMPYLNLRNHRKLLVADGYTGFTGGMNIREGHALRLDPAHPVQDLHFRVQGPVVAQMMDVFAEDWAFTTEEHLTGEEWYPPLNRPGGTLARGIAAGPDEDFERLYWTYLGALSWAQRSVRIVTPYFLPDRPLMTALQLAAIRGVTVDIILPQHGNLRLVQWAATAQLWQVLQWGCRVWLTPPPFDHSKLLVVDDAWSLIGSGNWDARSFRLNFEFGIECYDTRLADAFSAIVESKLRSARALSLDEVNSRNLAVKLRDGLAWLVSPYL